MSATSPVSSSWRASTWSVIRWKLRASAPISSLRRSSRAVRLRGGRSPACRCPAASAMASTGRVSQRRAVQVVIPPSTAISAAAAASPKPVSRRMRLTTSSARFSIRTAAVAVPPGRRTGAALNRVAVRPVRSSMAELLVGADSAAVRRAIRIRGRSHRLQASAAAGPSPPGPGAAAASRTVPSPPAAAGVISAIQTPVIPSTSARRFASVCQALSTSVPSPVRVATSTIVVSGLLALVAAARVSQRRSAPYRPSSTMAPSVPVSSPLVVASSVASVAVPASYATWSLPMVVAMYSIAVLRTSACSRWSMRAASQPASSASSSACVTSRAMAAACWPASSRAVRSSVPP